ncbi:NAD(P)/FAD-dependent oxidoreductase [Desulfomonile tiedjei]|uniref:Thioredoxin reductase n=1 Tax=Desulfomonile tiedjei (strain ATCC 49306 / DSM 6799 / DCB-1) TaxID=706587 RepID=I4C5J1_DESTA|nr:NAD(P)/FAD-dependent oxidoreductase [Desulfomonile tiedjei]AFM24832.1 thioredoxin reductase [Desulfomonile tiedjei DSM 6799]
MKEVRPFDVLILGGGIAGMTAAIYLSRARVKTAILEKSICGGLCNYTYMVENFPSYISIHGMDLMQKVRDHVDHLGVSIEEVCMIQSMDISGTEKIIESDDAIYHGKALIVATGRKPIPLSLPECEQVHYCSICDGFPYAGKRVLVLGGGNSGFDESLYLMRIGISHLTLIEVADRFFAAKTVQDELLHNKNVEARTNTRVVDLILENKKLKEVVIENVVTGVSETIPVDGIFAFLGQKPETDFLKGIVNLDDDGYVLVGEDMSTNIPGVYSAGDLNRKRYRQLTTAMNDGTIAALTCERYISSDRC